MGLAAAHLGTAVSIIGVVGEDTDGETIKVDLRQAGIDCSAIAVASGQSTGLTVAIIREDGERCFISEAGASSTFDADYILSQWSLIKQHRALAIVGVFNTPALSLKGIQTCFQRAREDGITTIFDPGWDASGWQDETRDGLLSLLSSVDLFLPNEDEALAITQARDLPTALENLANACSGAVVIKRGSKGSIALSNGEILTVPARPVENANAVGAGDVYDAALVSALQLRFELRHAMEFASDAAAYYVARLDDRYPRSSDVNFKNQTFDKIQEMRI